MKILFRKSPELLEDQIVHLVDVTSGLFALAGGFQLHDEGAQKAGRRVNGAPWRNVQAWRVGNVEVAERRCIQGAGRMEYTCGNPDRLLRRDHVPGPGHGDDQRARGSEDKLVPAVAMQGKGLVGGQVL